MIDHRLECEARYWLGKYQTKVRRNGKIQARIWWDKVISDIERIRGEESAQELRNCMNKLRKEHE